MVVNSSGDKAVGLRACGRRLKQVCTHGLRPDGRSGRTAHLRKLRLGCFITCVQRRWRDPAGLRELHDVQERVAGLGDVELHALRAELHEVRRLVAGVVAGAEQIHYRM